MNGYKNQADNQKCESNENQRLAIEDFISVENLPVYLGGKAKLNYRIAPRNALSIYKVGTSILNYSEEETRHHLKAHQKVIEDANSFYRNFKDTGFKFEFDLENLSESFSKHIGF